MPYIQDEFDDDAERPVSLTGKFLAVTYASIVISGILVVIFR